MNDLDQALSKAKYLNDISERMNFNVLYEETETPEEFSKMLAKKTYTTQLVGFKEGDLILTRELAGYHVDYTTTPETEGYEYTGRVLIQRVSNIKDGYTTFDWVFYGMMDYE